MEVNITNVPRARIVDIRFVHECEILSSKVGSLWKSKTDIGRMVMTKLWYNYRVGLVYLIDTLQ